MFCCRQSDGSLGKECTECFRDSSALLSIGPSSFAAQSAKSPACWEFGYKLESRASKSTSPGGPLAGVSSLYRLTASDRKAALKSRTLPSRSSDNSLISEPRRTHCCSDRPRANLRWPFERPDLRVEIGRVFDSAFETPVLHSQ